MVYEKFIYLIDVIQFQCQKTRFFGQNCAMFGRYCAIYLPICKYVQYREKSSNYCMDETSFGRKGANIGQNVAYVLYTEKLVLYLQKI